MAIVKIDSDFIANGLTCPPGRGRVEYVCADQDPPGFYAEVRATSPGQCSYYLRYKDSDGVSRHVKVGRSNEISLAAARKKAREIKSSIVLGADCLPACCPRASMDRAETSTRACSTWRSTTSATSEPGT